MVNPLDTRIRPAITINENTAVPLLLTLVGASLTAVGIFLPAMQHYYLTKQQTMDYLDLSFRKGAIKEGLILLLVAFLATILASLRFHWGLLLTGLAAVAGPVYTLYQLREEYSKYQFSESTKPPEFFWGWAVIGIGATFILAAAIYGLTQDRIRRRMWEV